MEARIIGILTKYYLADNDGQSDAYIQLESSAIMLTMHTECEYPKAEEVIETGETPPRLGTYTPSPVYLLAMPSICSQELLELQRSSGTHGEQVCRTAHGRTAWADESATGELWS